MACEAWAARGRGADGRSSSEDTRPEPNPGQNGAILAFNIGNVPFNLQENLFDAIMPSLLPLAVTILIYFLSTKNVKTWKIMVGVVVVAFVLGALGILG